MDFDLTTAAGLAAATVILVQIILTAARLPDDASSRWGPLLALAVGVFLAIAQGASVGSLTGATLLSTVLLGVTAGAMSMGVHNVVTKSAAGTTVAKTLGVSPPA